MLRRTLLRFWPAALWVACVVFWAGAGLTQSQTYVGSKACIDCHPDEYKNFSSYAKKYKSDHSVQIMAKGLTKQELEECFFCHTTGYGKPGGFVSYEKTPELGHAGCEVCHGPGSEHVEYGGDPSLIKRKPSLEDCEVCHNEERVGTFNYKPLLHGGAH